MSDLFFNDRQNISLDGGELRYFADFLDQATAAELFGVLSEQVPWQQDSIRIAGRLLPVPRLTAWYGDPGASYSYSGIQLTPHPWFNQLGTLRRRVNSELDMQFNSALLNLYRDGRDSVAWHADDEPELGENPVIASVSLGAMRTLQLKRRQRDHSGSYKLPLASGSLLVMAGQTQHHWLHQVPKEPTVSEARINITFRRVESYV